MAFFSSVQQTPPSQTSPRSTPPRKRALFTSSSSHSLGSRSSSTACCLSCNGTWCEDSRTADGRVGAANAQKERRRGADVGPLQRGGVTEWKCPQTMSRGARHEPLDLGSRCEQET